MPDERNPTLQSLPVANYSSAIARAVEWLGDRAVFTVFVAIDEPPRIRIAAEFVCIATRVRLSTGTYRA
jgi:hypothetical protein